MLLDPSTGAAVLAGPDLVRMLGGEPGVQQELMRFQVETGTRVCTGLDDAGRELVRLRRLAAEAAARLGCRLVASGVAPYHMPGLAAVTGQPRYQELAARYGPVVADAGTCGCHVHVGVPSRDLGVQVLARLRPWLAPLLAVTANSPIVCGHDAGWASWRYAIQARWPTAVPPAVWPDAAAYDTTVRRLIGCGAALDERNIYFLARLSPRYPTIEVRVADVCLDVGTAVLAAGLIRALVATALAEARRGTPVAAAPARQVAAALTAAARQGLAGAAADPFTGQAVDAPVLRSRLLDHVYPALTEYGDTETITALLHRLEDRGTGADRQRALFTSAASTPAFITALARATLSGYEPARPRPPAGRVGNGGSATAARQSPVSKPMVGAAAQRPGPAREPGRTAIREKPVRVTASLDPAASTELDAGWGGAVIAASPDFPRLPPTKAIRAMIHAAAASRAVTSAVIAQLCQVQGLSMPWPTSAVRAPHQGSASR